MEGVERLQDVSDFPNFQIFESTLAKLIFNFTNFELTLESWLFDFTKVGSNLSKLTCAALVELLGQKKKTREFPPVVVQDSRGCQNATNQLKTTIPRAQTEPWIFNFANFELAYSTLPTLN